MLQTTINHLIILELRSEHILDKLSISVLHANVHTHEPAFSVGTGQGGTQIRNDNWNDHDCKNYASNKWGTGKNRNLHFEEWYPAKVFVN